MPDVLKFPGHIACDAESRSEIVVPIVIRGEVSHALNVQLRGEWIANGMLDRCYY